MKAQSLLELLDAAHLTNFVEGEFKSRGGIMLVGPPNTLKSTMVESAFGIYPNALILSDLNVQQLAKLRNDLAGGRYPTIAFSAFEKLYARHSSTASNLEGYILALVEEGFTRMSFDDQRMSAIKAKALVVGATTLSFYARKFTEWNESGFLRRFLWMVYAVKNPRHLEDAIHRWEMLPIDGITRRNPVLNIKYNLDKIDSDFLLHIAREQPDRSTGFILLKKIACVLKWKYMDVKGEKDRHLEILKDIAPCLTRNGGTIDL